PPMLMRVMSPSDGEQSVELDRPIQVVFSQVPDPLARFKVWLEKYPGGGIPASFDDAPTSVDIQGALVLVRPGAPLEVGSDYVLQVGPGIQSLQGAVLTTSWTAGFRTRQINPTNPKPTAVASMRPGVPCAFSDAGPRQCSPTAPSLP